MTKITKILILIATLCLLFRNSAFAQEGIAEAWITKPLAPIDEGQPAFISVDFPASFNVSSVTFKFELVSDRFRDGIEREVDMLFNSGTGEWEITISADTLGTEGLEFSLEADTSMVLIESDDFPIRVNIQDFEAITANSAFPNDIEAGGWYTISLPFDASLNLVSIFGTQELSGDDGFPLNWSAYRYLSGQDSLESVQNIVNDSQGYFLYHDDTFDIGSEASLAQTGAGSNQEDAFEEIRLQPGWNLIAWPFTFSVTFERADGADAIISKIWNMENGTWISPAGGNFRFDPYAGYAVFNKSAIDTPLIAEDGPDLLDFKSVVVGKGAPGSVWDTQAEWQIRFMAKTEHGRDDFNFIGTSPMSKSGIDSRDEPEPPRMGTALSVSFPAEGLWGRLCSDMRSSQAPGNTWDMKIDTKKKRAVVDLSWERFNLSGGVEAVLIDISNNRSVNLLNGLQYTFESKKENLFKIVVGESGYVEAQLEKIVLPERFSISQNYPNPFNPKTKIDFEIASAGNVQIKIYNVMGNEIRTLADGFRQTGAHSVEWDGKDRFGKTVSSGTYFYRLIVRRTNSKGFVKTKKMMLLK